ncbi:XrtA/PEP-CTERM system TPR-repeat protein PrsT [Candidatus Moduliflexota bacterium]
MYKTILTVLLVVLFSSPACGSKPKEELFTEGVKLLGENNPGGATVLFKNALDQDPNFYEARFQLARAYLASGKVDAAEQELQKVVTQNPSFSDARIEMARAYLLKSKLEEALRELESVLEDDPMNVKALTIAGAVHGAKGDHEKAEQLLARALEEDPGDAGAHMTMANLMIAVGRPGDAERLLRELLQIDPDHNPALHQMAQLQLQEQDREAALGTYDRLIETYPTDLKAFYKKGMILIDQGKYDEAGAIAEKLKGTFPNRPEGSRLKGLGFFYSRNYVEAITELQKAVAIQTTPGDLYYLGLAHYGRGEYEQALSQFQKTLDLSPSSQRARELVAMVLLKQGRVDDAIAAGRNAVENDAGSALAHKTLGDAYIAGGMMDEGMDELNRALEINPDLAEVHLKKGLVDLKMGRDREGADALRTAVEANPDKVDSRLLLASYHMKKKEYGKAIETLEEGMNGNKQDAVLHNFVASVLLKQGKVKEGVAELETARKLDPDHLPPYFNLAVFYLSRGERDKGIQVLEDALKRSPENVRVLIALGWQLETEGSKEGALEHYKRAAAAEGTEGDLTLAGYYTRQKELEKALQTVDGALSKVERPDIRLHELKGRLLFSLGKPEEGTKAYEELDKAFPGKALPFLVQAYVSIKRPDRALKIVEDAVKEHPQNVGLKVWVSKLNQVMGRREKAIENARRIIDEHPDAPEGYVTLARLLIQYGKIDEGLSTLKNAKSVDDGRISMELGSVMEAQRKFDAALAEYKAAEKKQPGNVAPVYQQGVVYTKQGKEKEAIERYEKVLEFSSSHVASLNNLAYLYAEGDKDLDKAGRMAARAYMARPQDGRILDTLGYILLKSGKDEESLKVLKKAAEMVPDNPTIHYHLALAYRDNGLVTGAVESLEKAVRMGRFPEAGSAESLLKELKEN